MHRLTLCLIARDEESMLEACLASVRGLVDAIVLVDTGSTDRTVAIARAHGAVIVARPWDDDFAAARNAALPHVAGGFVLSLDADERLAPGAHDAIRAALARDDLDCGLLPLHDAATLEATAADVLSGRARRGEPVLLPRLLRRTPDLAWEGIVHEQVAGWARRHPRIAAVDAPIVHYGAVPSLREARAKNERNLRLLERRCARDPDDAAARAYLARELERAGDTAGALRQAEAAFSAVSARAAVGHLADDAVFPATLLAFLHIRAGEPARALDVLARARGLAAPHPNLHLLEGWAREHLAIAALCEPGATAPGGAASPVIAAHLAAGRAALEACLALDGRAFVAESLPGATGFVGRTRLGTVLLLAGEHALAEAHFRAAIGARPAHLEAHLGLAESLLAAGRASEALRALQPALRPEVPDAWLLGAAVAHALGSAADARLFFGQARQARASHAWVSAHRARLAAQLEAALAPG